MVDGCRFIIKKYYGCFTRGKVRIWILIKNAHFELRSVHTIEVLTYFELRSIHTSDRNCDLPFESVEKWRGCVWVPSKQTRTWLGG